MVGDAWRFARLCLYALSAITAVACGGCASASKNVVRPLTAESAISPELQNFRDAAIETQLKGDVRPAFPTVLAIAKLAPYETSASYYASQNTGPAYLALPRDAEAAGWQALTGPWTGGRPDVLVEQIQFITPLLAPAQPTSRQMREAAAMLHAPIMLVYTHQEDRWMIQNDLAAFYWTIIGLWCAPGHSVGTYTTYHGLLIDTETGFVLATAIGQAGRQEDCVPGAVDIVASRTRATSRAAALEEFQKDVRRTIESVAVMRGIRAAPPR